MTLLRPGEEWLPNYILVERLSWAGDINGRLSLNAHVIADALSVALKRKYRYCLAEKSWYTFDGDLWVKQRYVYDDIIAALGEIRSEIKKRMETEVGKKYILKNYAGVDNCNKYSFVYEVISNLEKMEILHILPDDFDYDRRVINTPNGVYELTTLERFINAPEYLCRHITKVSPKDDENGRNCPYYLQHLEFMANGNKSIMDYLELISGYLCTGETDLDQFYWLFGLGGNGKSALLETWAFILGDLDESSYYFLAPSDLFAKTRHQHHPEIYMRFIGKRFIYIDELDGNAWSEPKLKAAMSDAGVRAREMGGSSINFRPAYKLIFSSNHKPVVNSIDGGMARRMHLMDFPRQIPENMKINGFKKQYLLPEAPYIFNRMLKNAQRVLQTGKIELPESFKTYTKDYISGGDQIKQFIDDACNTGAEYHETKTHLYIGYTLWAHENGFDPISQKQFNDQMQDAGYKEIRLENTRCRKAIQLKPAGKQRAAQTARYG